MKNMADIQRGIAEMKIEISDLRVELARKNAVLMSLEIELQNGCPHPLEFRLGTVKANPNGFGPDSADFLCNICNKRLGPHEIS